MPRRATHRQPKKSQPPRLRARLWVEIDSQPALTDAGADLLEQIAVCESVSEAARRLHFSYRRAWMLVDAMNHRWPGALVSKSVGGRRGGGTRLTELGRTVLRSYRDAQVRLEYLLDECGIEMSRSIRQPRR